MKKKLPQLFIGTSLGKFKKLSLFLVLLCTCYGQALLAHERISSIKAPLKKRITTATLYVKTGEVYVKAGATGANDGTSWEDAYTNLQTAIDDAVDGQKNIWVAKGTYQPTNNGESFSMKEGVKIYGGFAGTETALTERNWKTNVTILQGNGNSVVYNNSNGLTNTAALDGFTVMGGGNPSQGGGIHNISSSPVLRNLIIRENTAAYGGGIYNISSSPVLTNVTISGNTAGLGGGINNQNSSPILTNVTISGNKASTLGGGILNASSFPVLTNVTISGNICNNEEFGGGIYNVGSYPKIRNSIIYSNSSGIYNSSSLTLEISNSLVQGMIADAANFNLDGNTDPLFIDPQLPGLSTAGNYRLRKGSPALNVGNNNFYASGETPNLSGITTDLDGKPRILNTTVDMGAYEGATIYVNKIATGSNNGTNWQNAYTNLQTAVTVAANGDEIWVAKGDYQPAEGQYFSMKEGVKIYGGFVGTEINLTERNWKTNVTRLQGNGNSVIRNDNNGLTNVAVLDGFTITGGNTSFGGGMCNYSSSPTLRNIIISGNTASSSGGGIYNYRSSPTLINVILSGNTSGFYGGAMCNVLPSSPILSNVTISGNVAATNGGAMFNSSSTPIIRNSIIYNNNSGIYNDGSSPTITYSLVQGLTNTDNGNISGNIDPMFVEPQSPGLSSEGNYRLLVGSTVLNKGDNSAVPEGVNTDLDGNLRIQDATVDLGAYEGAAARGRIYVNANASGANNGTTWGNAYTKLETAIAIATNGDEIWVAKGDYQPAAGQSFSMKEGIKIYGGFIGIETELAQRNWKTNVTKLQGNGSRVIDNDNNGLTTNAILDGLTITGGNANFGGGIRNVSSSPFLTNLIINGNTATNDGGGIFNLSSSSPVLTNIIISGNVANGYGGAISNDSSSPVLTNLTISGNSASLGWAILNNRSNPKIRNSIIYGNNSGIYNGDSFPEIQYSLVQGLTGTGTGNINGNTNPLFVAPLAPGLSTGGNYSLQTGSPAINSGSNSFYNADQTPDLSGITTDLDGNQRIKDGIVDLGAYEGTEVSLPVTLTSYTAKAEGNHAKLQWQTTSEQNNKGFEIYRSGDDKVFVKIDEVPPTINHGLSTINYTYTDKTPLNGNNYYKLVQVDRDGTAIELGVRLVAFHLQPSAISLYPNPAKDRIYFSGKVTGGYMLYNSLGQKLQSGSLDNISAGLDVSTLPSGVYHISIGGKSYKLLKQ